MNCQIETERGTCGNQSYSECWDCLKPICDEHIGGIAHARWDLCEACQLKRASEEGHIDDCPMWCGEPCKCYVRLEVL